jgi:hypothetical protein
MGSNLVRSAILKIHADDLAESDMEDLFRLRRFYRDKLILDAEHAPT